MQSYKICLIRHGITRANEEGLYVGKTDLPLSPSGLSRLIGRKKDSLYPPATRFLDVYKRQIKGDTGEKTAFLGRDREKKPPRTLL